jgi:hypothetical protein
MMSSISPVAVIAAACIAGFIALIGMMISKENKTTEFRQAWIDGQRSDLAQLLALANSIRAAPSSKKAHELIERYEIALNMIALRENPRVKTDRRKRERWGEIVSLGEELRRLCTAGPRYVGKAVALRRTMISLAKIELKNEWERVKEGEPTFVTVRQVIAVLAGTGALIVGLSMIAAGFGF